MPGAAADGGGTESGASHDVTRDSPLLTLAKVMRRVDRSTLALKMVEACSAQVEAYARLPASFDGRKLHVMRSNVELFSRLAEEERALNDADLDGPRRVARGDVENGIPLEAALQAYRIGGATAWREFAHAAEPDEHAIALLAATDLYFNFTERVSAAVTEVYAAELRRHDAGWHRDALALFKGLIAGDPDSQGLARRAARAKLELGEEYTPFVARSSTRSSLELAGSLQAAETFAVSDAGMVSGFVQEPAHERTLLRSGATFARAPRTPREELADAFESLRHMVDVGVLAGRRGEIGEHEFLLERSLRKSPAIARGLERLVVVPLVAHDAARGSDLMHTLKEFLDSGMKRKVAAERLHVHPNTLDGRLSRISALTGLDLALPNDLAVAIVALSWRETPNAISEDGSAAPSR